MNIKRVVLFITIIAISLVLSSCISAKSMIKDREFELNASSDDKIADTRFQKIIEALDKKDKKELKKMFSRNALKEGKDIDGGIEYIMKFYKGKMKSKDRTVVTKDSINNGEKKSELDCKYVVTTDEDTYIVFFIDQIVDNKNTDNVGLYMLQIIKESDREKEFDGGGDKTKCAGIYRPDTAK